MVEEKMSWKTKYALVMHFDSCSGLSYDREGKSKALGKDQNSKWWTARRKMLKEYVIPSVLNIELGDDKETDLDMIALFDESNKKLSYSTRKLLEENGFVVEFNRDDSIRKLYQGEDFDFLVLIHLDSDDMYHENILTSIMAVEPSRGMMMFCEDGYMLDVKNGDLYRFVSGENGPGPYFAGVYTRASLQNEDNWYKYRQRFKLHKLHFELRQCPNKVVLPSGLFCGTIHGANTTRSLKNKNTAKRIGDKIEPKAAEEILKSFGR